MVTSYTTTETFTTNEKLLSVDELYEYGFTKLRDCFINNAKTMLFEYTEYNCLVAYKPMFSDKHNIQCPTKTQLWLVSYNVLYSDNDTDEYLLTQIKSLNELIDLLIIYKVKYKAKKLLDENKVDLNNKWYRALSPVTYDGFYTKDTILNLLKKARNLSYLNFPDTSALFEINKLIKDLK